MIWPTSRRSGSFARKFRIPPDDTDPTPARVRSDSHAQVILGTRAPQSRWRASPIPNLPRISRSNSTGSSNVRRKVGWQNDRDVENIIRNDIDDFFFEELRAKRSCSSIPASWTPSSTMFWPPPGCGWRNEPPRVSPPPRSELKSFGVIAGGHCRLATNAPACAAHRCSAVRSCRSLRTCWRGSHANPEIECNARDLGYFDNLIAFPIRRAPGNVILFLVKRIYSWENNIGCRSSKATILAWL